MGTPLAFVTIAAGCVALASALAIAPRRPAGAVVDSRGADARERVRGASLGGREFLDLRRLHADGGGGVQPAADEMAALDSPRFQRGSRERSSSERILFNAASSHVYRHGSSSSPLESSRSWHSAAARGGTVPVRPYSVEHLRRCVGDRAARAGRRRHLAGALPQPLADPSAVRSAPRSSSSVAAQIRARSLSPPLVIALILHFAYRHSTGRMGDELRHLAEINRLHLRRSRRWRTPSTPKTRHHGHIRRPDSGRRAARRLGRHRTRRSGDRGRRAAPRHRQLAIPSTS